MFAIWTLLNLAACPRFEFWSGWNGDINSENTCFVFDTVSSKQVPRCQFWRV